MVNCNRFIVHFIVCEKNSCEKNGASWELNPGPLTCSAFSSKPKARIIPLDHTPECGMFFPLYIEHKTRAAHFLPTLFFANLIMRDLPYSISSKLSVLHTASPAYRHEKIETIS